NKNVKNKIRDILRMILTVKGYSFFRFLVTHQYLPSFSNPSTFSEKVQHRKFYTDPTMWSRFVDKYTVRGYVSEIIGEQYLIPLIARYESLDVSDFDYLPERFVIKTSNGGGGVNVKVVNNKDNLIINDVITEFNKACKEKIGSKIDEYFYDINSGCILIEELISNADCTPLLDYKFHIFRNKGDIFILLQINSDYGKENETKTLYNLNGLRSEIQFSYYNLGPKNITLPNNFPKMLELAKSLSSGFDYVRIDLYNVDEVIYFGEITVCPASGWDKINTKKHDDYLGKMWGGANF
ncbi:ATP-grasp fold amidoligase family protein, partial [Vibrio kanaloae]